MLTPATVNEAEGTLTTTVEVDGTETKITLNVRSLTKELEAKKCTSLIVMLRGLFPGSKGLPNIQGYKRTEFVQGIIYGLEQGRITYINPVYFSKKAKKSCYSRLSSWETIVVCALKKHGQEREDIMNKRYQKNKDKCEAASMEPQIYGSGPDDCKVGHLLRGSCCMKLTDHIKFITTNMVEESCENCEDMPKEPKQEIVSAFKADEDALNRYVSTMQLNPSQQNWIQESVKGIQQRMFNDLSVTFSELFDLVEIDSCRQDVTDKYFKAVQDGTWQDVKDSGEPWTLSVILNPIGYGFQVIYRFIKWTIGMAWSFLKSVGGAIWSMAQWFAAYVVYHPKQTKIILFVLNTQKIRICRFVGNYLFENGYLDSLNTMLEGTSVEGQLDLDSFRKQQAKAATKEAKKGILEKGGDALSGVWTTLKDTAGNTMNKEEIFLEISRSDTFKKSTDTLFSYGSQLLGGAVKSIPVIGGIAGAAIDITAEITKDSLVAASTAQLEASAFTADIEQVFSNFMSFLDFNSCVQEIPGVKARFPNIAQLGVLMKKDAKYSTETQQAEWETWSVEKQEDVQYVLMMNPDSVYVSA